MNKDEYEIVSGVHKVLVGLAEIVESLPDTNESSDLWTDNRAVRPMKPELKLYVWSGFEWDWQNGLAVAIAETEEEAKELVLEEYYLPNIEIWGELEVLEISKCARCVGGHG